MKNFIFKMSPTLIFLPLMACQSQKPIDISKYDTQPPRRDTSYGAASSVNGNSANGSVSGASNNEAFGSGSRLETGTTSATTQPQQQMPHKKYHKGSAPHRSNKSHPSPMTPATGGTTSDVKGGNE